MTTQTKLQSLVDDFNNTSEQTLTGMAGGNDYTIANDFLRAKGIRATNKQVWAFINEVLASAGEAADW